MDLKADVTIKDIGSDGEGIGTLPSGKTVFVRGALPGEVCRIEIINEKAKFCEGKLKEILTASPDRTGSYEDTPPGAGLSHLSYEAQLRYKEQKVRSCLQRLGRQDEDLLAKTIKPTFPSGDIWHYRNHMQYKISDNKICLTASSSDELIPAGDSPLEYIVFNNIRETLEEVFGHAPTTLFCGLVLRGSERTKQVLIEFVSDSPAPHETVLRDVKQYIESTDLKERLTADCPYEIKGILLRISSTSVSKRVRSGKRFTIAGEDFYEEELCGCNFRIKAGAFFQVNIPQAEHLYRFAAEDLKDEKVIWDVYCGTGSIGLSVTGKDQTLIGIESVQEAVNSAKINASLSGRDDARFICRPAERMDLNKDDLPHPDAVIVDPPRKGMDPKFVRTLLTLSPGKISYVSCDPATMARDIRTLTEGGYKLLSVRPVDMFPNTPHVETVCLLTHHPSP
ncbi:23S rRNA (uracil1939-C5)-methyltransferase [Oscillospiraceae bacterium]|nr:23S rRNA (uracil1939-C5)-methyltransferase [Oscillospiraceae bacterium]